MGVALVLWGWAFWQGNCAHPLPGPKAFRATPPVAVQSNEPAFFQRAFIDPQETAAFVHASTICELPGGGFCAAWYGGTREGAGDVAISFSKKIGEEPWTTPRSIVNRETARAELSRYVRKVGNSVIFADSHKRLWLVYVSIALGGWSGSSLNVKISEDEGATWTASRHLTLSPFLNQSELVRCKPFSITEEAIGVPIYQEFVRRFPEIVWFSGSGDAARVCWSKQRIAGGNSYIQPTVVCSEGNQLQAFLRDCTMTHTLAVSDSSGDANSWQKPRRLALPNPGSGLDAVSLADGRLLMVFNDSSKRRENLRLAVSRDKGQTWQRVATLEAEAGEDFSYPCMIQDRAGRIHIVYSWKHKHIQHVVFNLAWLDRQTVPDSKR